MTKSVLQMQTPDEAEIIFYEAFMHGDIDVMAALWADDNVICVHPGSGVISGYESVMRSWQHILEGSAHMDIRYRVENKMVTDELAVHVVIEEMLNINSVIAVVVATNIYKKFENGWLIAEHHGSVVNTEQKSETLQ
ncbi:MAG: nuclear transport factor 2 family protein [Gammaproteobacteria bacterium]|nr:nuclear transport factor 2 family protein [Gammaproteobacteria bacterium]MCW8986115.1 nuclear transport factor 2 family protein [Gammaproteobacteria bacterium]